MIFIEGDGVLFAGDVVMNRRFLAFNTAASSVRSWIDSLDRLASLRPQRIVPSHGDMGDGSLIESGRSYLRELQTRATALKREGKTVDETAELVTAEIRAKYPDWTGNPAAAVRSAYNEVN
jgi:glyoxylase-like metal-dependent hydrolase (beta-lactamase superfamily II)